MTAATLTRQSQQGKVTGVEFFAFGEGDPVTVFAHGLQARCRRRSPCDATVRHAGAVQLSRTRRLGRIAQWLGLRPLADDLRTVADHVGATGACGLSLGAGALLRLLVQTLDRFDRLAFVMPHRT